MNNINPFLNKLILQISLIWFDKANPKQSKYLQINLNLPATLDRSAFSGSQYFVAKRPLEIKTRDQRHIKLTLFRYLENIFNDLLFSYMFLQLIFKVWKSKPGKNYNLARHNSVLGDLKNLEKIWASHCPSKV